MAKRSATEERQPRCQPVPHHMQPEHSSFGVSLIFHPPRETLPTLAAGQLCSPGQDQGQGGRWTAGRDAGRAAALFLWPHCTRPIAHFWGDLSTPSANFPPPPPADHVSQNKAEQETRSASGGPERATALSLRLRRSQPTHLLSRKTCPPLAISSPLRPSGCHIMRDKMGRGQGKSRR